MTCGTAYGRKDLLTTSLSCLRPFARSPTRQLREAGGVCYTAATISRRGPSLAKKMPASKPVASASTRSSSCAGLQACDCRWRGWRHVRGMELGV